MKTISSSGMSQQAETPDTFIAYLFSRTDMRLALVGFTLLLLSFLADALGVSRQVQTILQGLALLLAGYPVARCGLVNLWINHDFNIQMLMTIAGIGAS